MRRAVTLLHRSARRLGRSLGRLGLLALVGAATARAQEVRVPPSLLLLNYDRVNPGLVEALEAGAVIARSRNAPAVAYNPAGIALTDRTILNASAQGYQLTALGGTGFDHATPVSSFEAIPSFLGIVLGREVIDWETVRIGFAVVTPMHWDQSVIASTVPEASQRVSYSVHSSFSSVVPTVSVGWAVVPTFRLGASLEFPYTSLSNEGQLSGELTSASESLGSIRTLSAGGSTLDVVGVVGAQWTALPWLHLGLVFRTPGLKILSTGNFQYETLVALAGGSRQTFFSDPDARFELRSPMQAGVGVAVEFGLVQLEVDLRWHDGTHTYQLLSSTREGRVVDTTSGAPVVSTFDFPGIPYRARPVVNVSVGGHVTLAPSVILSAGVYRDESPVDLLGQGFRRVDMFGIRTGVGFLVGKVGASIGVGWEHGTATDDLVPDTTSQPQHDELSVDTFSVFFSLSLRF